MNNQELEDEDAPCIEIGNSPEYFVETFTILF